MIIMETAMFSLWIAVAAGIGAVAGALLAVAIGRNNADGKDAPDGPQTVLPPPRRETPRLTVEENDPATWRNRARRTPPAD